MSPCTINVKTTLILFVFVAIYSGIITVVGELDRETVERYTLLVSVSDSTNVSHISRKEKIMFNLLSLSVRHTYISLTLSN